MSRQSAISYRDSIYSILCALSIGKIVKQNKGRSKRWKKDATVNKTAGSVLTAYLTAPGTRRTPGGGEKEEERARARERESIVRRGRGSRPRPREKGEGKSFVRSSLPLPYS